MSTYRPHLPDQLPVLSRGKHRNPRKGACFMELASFLAGERWSDHPACTHPLLAALARHVNDRTSDAGRPRLAVLIPSVIGLTSPSPHVDARIALRAARTALPVVAADRQRVMAVGIMSCERVLDDLDRRPVGTLEDASRRALEQAPHATQWALKLITEVPVSSAGFRRRAAPHIVSSAVEGIARACIPDIDAVLYDLLVETVDECRRLIHPDAGAPTTVDPGRWNDVCQLTGSAPHF